jgi:transposase
MTEDVIPEVVSRYNRGMTITNIATDLNLSYTAVAKWIDRHLPPRDKSIIKRKRGTKSLTEENKIDIRLMRAEGNSMSEIAEKLGVKMSTVRSFLDREKKVDFSGHLQYVDDLLLEIKTLRKENDRLVGLVAAYKDKLAALYQTEIIRTLAGDDQVIDLDELKNKNKNQK